jgi:hypothetical protein
MNLEVLFQLGSLLFLAAGPLVIILLAVMVVVYKSKLIFTESRT